MKCVYYVYDPLYTMSMVRTKRKGGKKHLKNSEICSRNCEVLHGRQALTLLYCPGRPFFPY